MNTPASSAILAKNQFHAVAPYITATTNDEMNKIATSTWMLAFARDPVNDPLRRDLTERVCQNFAESAQRSSASHRSRSSAEIRAT